MRRSRRYHAKRIRKALALGWTYEDGHRIAARKSVYFVLYLRCRRAPSSRREAAYYRRRHFEEKRT